MVESNAPTAQESVGYPLRYSRDKANFVSSAAKGNSASRNRRSDLADLQTRLELEQWKFAAPRARCGRSRIEAWLSAQACDSAAARSSHRDRLQACRRPLPS